MPTIKTVQVPLMEWALLKALAVKQDRTIASYLRNKIREDAAKEGIKIVEM